MPEKIKGAGSEDGGEIKKGRDILSGGFLRGGALRRR